MSADRVLASWNDADREFACDREFRLPELHSGSFDRFDTVAR